MFAHEGSGWRVFVVIFMLGLCMSLKPFWTVSKRSWVFFLRLGMQTLNILGQMSICNTGFSLHEFMFNLLSNK